MAGGGIDDPVEDTVQRLAELHHNHYRSTGAIQRVADRATSALGRPVAVAAVLLLTGVWLLGNAMAERLGIVAWESFPYPELALVATISAVFLALLILTTQRHADELADKRAQLTLQIAILSEKKIGLAPLNWRGICSA